MKIGVIAGSFDPITNGHLGLINQAMQAVDQLHVVVGHNPSKKYLFTPQERLEMVQEVLLNEWCDAYNQRITVVLSEKELLVQYAQSIKADFLIRGIRNASDFEYEYQLNLINKKFQLGNRHQLDTMYFIPDRNLTEISSSVVKGLVGFDKWEYAIRDYVPQYVIDRLKEKHENRTV